MTGSEALLGVATLLKRVKNITKGVPAPSRRSSAATCLTEPAEQALASRHSRRVRRHSRGRGARRLSRGVHGNRGAAAGGREVLR